MTSTEPVKAGESEETPNKPAGQDDEFQRGAKLTRAAGLWMLGALSATGIGLFGAQPAVRGQAFSWSNETDRIQLTVAALLGFIGIVAIANLIYRIARLQAAVRYTLSTLPPKRQAWINQNRQTELPDDAPDLTAFQTNLNTTRRKIPEYAREVQVLKNEIKAEANRDARESLRLDLAKFEAAIEQLNERLAIYLIWKSKIINEAQENTLNEQLLGPRGEPG
ncbi:hypothetical protein [Pseudarthrobacter sp. MDT1-22]